MLTLNEYLELCRASIYSLYFPPDKIPMCTIDVNDNSRDILNDVGWLKYSIAGQLMLSPTPTLWNIQEMLHSMMKLQITSRSLDLRKLNYRDKLAMVHILTHAELKTYIPEVAQWIISDDIEGKWSNMPISTGICMASLYDTGLTYDPWRY